MDEDNNILQQLLGTPSIAGAPPSSQAIASATGMSQAPTISSQPRRSLLDVIGRAADVFAKVGGAEALYQPTLDARADRARLIDMDALRKRHDQQEIDQGDMKLQGEHNTVLGQGARGLRAIFDKTGAPGVQKAWPFLAHQLGIDDQHTAIVGQALSEDPEGTISALEAAMRDPKLDAAGLGLNPFYATDADGHLQAYQLGKGGQVVPVKLPDGQHPSDPIKIIDTGDSQVVVGGKSGQPQRVLPKAGGPEKGERPIVNDQGQVIRYAPVTGSSLEYNRENPDPKGDAKAARERTAQVAGAQNTLALLNNVQRGFDALHRMGALAGDPVGTGQAVAAGLGRTKVGQMVGEQAGSAAAQQRLEITKNLSNLQQAMLKSLPASATRTRFEQEMLQRGLPDPTKMSYATARQVIGELRQSFLQALRETAPPAGKSAAPRAAPKPAARRQPARTIRPTVSNW